VRKIFCDVCGREGAENRFSYKAYLACPIWQSGLFDFSYRQDITEISADLCNNCYEEIVGPAVQKLSKKEISLAKKQAKQETKHVPSR
jgi:hypothetical protein